MGWMLSDLWEVAVFVPHTLEHCPGTSALLLFFTDTENEPQSVLEVLAQLGGRGQVLPPFNSVPVSPLVGSGCIIFWSGTQQWIIIFIFVCFPQPYHSSVFFHLVCFCFPGRGKALRCGADIIDIKLGKQKGDNWNQKFIKLFMQP